jgi:hypothetical protein
VLPSPLVPRLPRLVGARVLDAPLAALAWLLLERGVPVIVAGPATAVADALLDAFVSALPRDRRPDPGQAAGGDRLVRVAGRLGIASPTGTLRAALAATTRRSGLAVAVAADDLAGVLAVLRGQGLTDDEIAFMGVILVVGPPAGQGAGEGARVLAAHYLRPVVLDAGGHPRRLAPAVLSTWDPASDTWDDYAWGIATDLAERARMRAGDLQTELERRAAALTDHAGGGPVG